MKYAVSGNDMKYIDNFTIEKGMIPSLTLMERAANGVCDELIKDCTNPRDVQFLLVCGKGNNGADGIAMARLFKRNGLDATVIVIGAEKLPDESVFESSIDEAFKDISISTKEWVYQYKEAIKIDVNIICYEEGIITKLYKNSIKSATVIVDAMVGVGLKSPLRGHALVAADEINNLRAKNRVNELDERMENNLYVYGVDVPSGVGFDGAVFCHKVVTFGCLKKELILTPGCKCVGSGKIKNQHINIEENIVVKNIGFLKEAFNDVDVVKVIEEKDLKKLPPRDAFGNKGTFGKVYILAGSVGMCGAAVFSSKAAYRTGAGLVKILSKRENVPVYQTLIPEAILSVYDELSGSQIADDIKWADAVVLGPGLGTEEESVRIVRLALNASKKYNKSLIIDADGLNIIAAHRELMEEFYEGIIITPHIGEMARLLRTDISSVKEDVLNVARQYAIKHGITVVLKDARTVITDGADTYVNIYGHSGMAKAGSGDILTGIIAAVKTVYDKENTLGNVYASAVAACVHSFAAVRTSKDKRPGSIMASDIIEGICDVYLP